MDIKKINESCEPGYPTLDKHQINRRGMLKAVIGGLAAAGIVGCKSDPPEIMGEMPMATPPGPPPGNPPEIMGKMVAPKLPKKPKRPQIDGDMPAPREPDRPALGGVMMAPQAPVPEN